MRGLLYVFLIFGFLTVFSNCENDEPEDIIPDEVTIVDDNFLNALIENGVDTNGDSIISVSEAEAMTGLDISLRNIADMTGIEAFVNLKKLYAGVNQLTFLDVSKNTALTGLYLGSNQLTQLDVSNNTALEWLGLGRNLLTSLDLSNNTALTELDLQNNRLTSLDISNSVALTTLYLFSDRTTFWNNQLTHLDISNNTALTLLRVEGNRLTHLDVSNNTSLKWMDLSDNQLTSLDISHNTNLKFISLNDMRSLHRVCVWEMPFPPDEVGVSAMNSPNVYFTTDCTGGD